MDDNESTPDRGRRVLKRSAIVAWTIFLVSGAIAAVISDEMISLTDDVATVVFYVSFVVAILLTGRWRSDQRRGVRYK